MIILSKKKYREILNGCHLFADFCTTHGCHTRGRVRTVLHRNVAGATFYDKQKKIRQLWEIRQQNM